MAITTCKKCKKEFSKASAYQADAALHMHTLRAHGVLRGKKKSSTIEDMPPIKTKKPEQPLQLSYGLHYCWNCGCPLDK